MFDAHPSGARDWEVALGYVPFEEGRHLAVLIPNARFAQLDSKNHLLLESESAWRRFVDEINEFINTPNDHGALSETRLI
jgi:hypothetical protein